MARSHYLLVGAGTALIACCYGLARFTYGLFAPAFTDEFGLSGALAGGIGAGSYIGYCASIVLSLLLTDRIGARRVAVIAGAVATVGISIVAAAPSAWVLAAGILIAGCSTGLASPPLAAAVAQSVPAGLADRAQTVVNGGTGIGVVASAPIALLIDQWRVAWALYAILAAVVTIWVARSVPATARTGANAVESSWRPGLLAMLVAALLMGIGSVAVWTFGRDLIVTVGGAGPARSTLLWIVIGAASIAGAFAGDAVARIGLRWAWAAATVTMAAATLLLAAAPAALIGILVAATLFGAAYLALTGLMLLWSTRLYPDRAAFGVGVAFFTIAAGQALGAPLTGALIDAAGARSAFVVIAALGLCALALRPPSPR